MFHDTKFSSDVSDEETHVQHVFFLICGIITHTHNVTTYAFDPGLKFLRATMRLTVNRPADAVNGRCQSSFRSKNSQIVQIWLFTGTIIAVKIKVIPWYRSQSHHAVLSNTLCSHYLGRSMKSSFTAALAAVSNVFGKLLFEP